MKTNDFINSLKENQDLARKLIHASSPDEAYKIAKETGVTDDSNTFFAEMKKFKDTVTTISPEEMGSLVNSASTSEIVSAVSTWIGAAAAAASAAAI